MGWSSYPASSRVRQITWRTADCWSARSAITALRSRRTMGAWRSPGRRTRYSFSRTPERPPFLERRPRGLEGNDQHALARGERLAGIRRRRSSKLGCAAARRDLGEQASRDGDVVEVSKNVLKRFQALDVGPRRDTGKGGSEEVAGVAQPFHPDAQPVAALGVVPVDVLRLLQRFAMQPLQRRRRKRAKRALGFFYPSLPWPCVHPTQSAQEEGLQLGRCRGLARSPRARARSCAIAGARSGSCVPMRTRLSQKTSQSRAAPRAGIRLRKRAAIGFAAFFGTSSRNASSAECRRRRPTRIWCRYSGSLPWTTPRAFAPACARAAAKMAPNASVGMASSPGAGRRHLRGRGNVSPAARR